ncbi:hypothetical protein SAMN05421664_2288 [Chryseobacterium soldanellicola]|uniref:Uncharacterized protein n=1 Tax=Chryseobacterium soldanellicola TaxID=311333 RepID=A0A1H1D595_9FLAO|nr:hypothetical protein [Chryseobacterium soldanellicola]SDQ71348.1 hypothetical protein SAMN05421664_2288 [Chryseobacterium soldanellicola]
MKKITFTSLLFLTVQFLYGQVGIGTAYPNTNSVLELSSTNKGFILPRVALTATNNASPVSSHIAGMTVYNTATNTSSASNPVYPGEYYNDGTQWNRKITASETRMLVGGTITDQLSPTSVTLGDGSSYNDATLITLPSFTLTKPSVVEFSGNISSVFTKVTDLPLTDSSVKLASVYFLFTNAPSGIPVNSKFGSASMSYTNTSSTNGNVISGYYYLTPHAILNLPAGTYTLAMKGGGASDTGYKLLFGDAGSDNIQVKATPIK